MRVILEEKVANLGTVGDQVVVRSGYARNYLLPYGKAVSATPAALADFEKRRAMLEKRAEDMVTAARARATQLAELVVTLAARASEEGKLFGSVGPREVADAVTKAGVAVNKSEVNLPSGPLRQTGEHEVHVQLHSDVATTVKVTIVAE